MNVCFVDQGIHFKVSHVEVSQLLVGKAVCLEVKAVRAPVFRSSISAHVGDQWQLEHDPTGLWLGVPRDELATLLQDGVQDETPTLTHLFSSQQHKLLVLIQLTPVHES